MKCDREFCFSFSENMKARASQFAATRRDKVGPPDAIHLKLDSLLCKIKSYALHILALFFAIFIFRVE
jgi:hypothetical protein